MLINQANTTRPRFDRNLSTPSFNALGWDIYNKQGYAEAYNDVIHEDAIKVGSVVKAPDYCFRIGGTRKFFLEAKQSVELPRLIPPFSKKLIGGVKYWRITLPCGIPVLRYAN